VDDEQSEASRLDESSESGGGDDNDGYQVGYGKPPRHTRFKPGRSGNPRGRPSGARGLKTDLSRALSGRHVIQINGKPLKGNRQELMMLTLATRAASGDLRAQALLIPLILQVLGANAGEESGQQLSAQDQALLDRMLSQFASAAPAADTDRIEVQADQARPETEETP